MARCCKDCKRSDIKETDTPGLYLMACPVTGGQHLHFSRKTLEQTWEGCVGLSCFEPKEDEKK